MDSRNKGTGNFALSACFEAVLFSDQEQNAMFNTDMNHTGKVEHNAIKVFQSPLCLLDEWLKGNIAGHSL